MKKYIGVFILVSIVIAVVIPYANSLRNPFIWDEEDIIVGNPIIKEWRYFPLLFKTSIFGGPIKAGGFYRPIYMLSFMLDYHLWGLNVFGYHLSSIIFHILNALLLYILAAKIGLQRRVAWLSALLFALFPVNSEAIAPIATRDGLILVFLSLLCMLLFLNGIKRSRIYFLGSAIVFAVAIFAKESALILPFIIMAYAFIFLEKPERRKVYAPLGILIGIAFLYCGFRFFFLGSPFSRTLSLINNASFLERVYTLPRVLWTYIRLTLFPIVLKSEYHFLVHSARNLYVLIGTPLLILFFILMNRALKPRKHTLFFSCWFLIGFLPHINIIIPLHATLLEHWAYFPSMAFAVLMSMAVFAVAKGRYRYVVIALVAGLVLFYVNRIIERNKEWGDPFVLYQKDSQREPDSFLLHCNLGVEYFRRGMLEEAKKEFIASNDASPGIGYDVAYNNLGVIYAREGNLPQAMQCYRRSIALNNYVLAYANLGGLYNNLEMYREAVLFLQEGERLYPLDVEIKYQLGVAYYKNGDTALAGQIFEEVENIHPSYSQTNHYLKLIKK